MFLVKSKEIAELKKDCERRDVALDDITAAAQATREASDQVTHCPLKADLHFQIDLVHLIESRKKGWTRSMIL